LYTLRCASLCTNAPCTDAQDEDDRVDAHEDHADGKYSLQLLRILTKYCILNCLFTKLA
jgi:hypothetical protein